MSKIEHEITLHGDVTVLAIRGRLDAVRVPGLRQVLVDLAEKAQSRVIVDLADLEWIDSSGVGALVSLYKRARQAGGDVKVAGLQRQPREIFRLLRLESAFEVFDNVDAALAKFRA